MGRMVRRPAGRPPEQQPTHEPPEDGPDAEKDGEPDQPRPVPAEVGAPQQVWPGNDVVKKLRPNYNCNCILGTTRPKEDAILIHEAPSIGAVVGSIGPRPKGDHAAYENKEGNPSHRSFLEIYNLISTVGGGQASLIVLDWG